MNLGRSARQTKGQARVWKRASDEHICAPFKDYEHLSTYTSRDFLEKH